MRLFYLGALYAIWVVLVIWNDLPDKPAQTSLTCPYAEELSRAIYIAEGKEKAKSPYGILSVKVHSLEEAKKICLTSIANNWKRWEKAGRPGCYVDYLANRWCPPSCDPVGNKNWKTNVKAYLTRRGVEWR